MEEETADGPAGVCPGSGTEFPLEAALADANAIVTGVEWVFARAYRGEVQLAFASDAHRAYAVVDMNLQLRGTYGHGSKAGGWEQCRQHHLSARHAEIE